MIAAGRGARAALAASCLSVLLVAGCREPARSPANGGTAPAPPDNPPAALGSPAVLTGGPGAGVGIEVRRCPATAQGTVERVGVLGPAEPICAKLSFAAEAAQSAAGASVVLTGATDPPVALERQLGRIGAGEEVVRFDPPGAWPLGAYRVALRIGEHELVAWELEIRADAAQVPSAGQ